MQRRTAIMATVSLVSGGLAGCASRVMNSGTPTPVVHEEFDQPYSESIDVSAGDTLRVEVTPLDPKYQLVMVLDKEENLDEEGGLYALTRLEEVNTKTAKEVTPESDTTYVLAVGWLNDDKNLDTSQYRLRVILKESG